MNKKYKKVIFIVTGITILMLLSKKAKAMTLKFTYSKFDDRVSKLLKFLEPSLIKAGFNTEFLLKLGISQLLLETGRFKKGSLYERDNNYSGIKYICKPFQKAERGSRTPPKEQSGSPDRCGNFYAHFENADDWAKDYYRILSLKRIGNKIGRPIDAKDVTDFNERLYANGYYLQTPTAKANYLKNLKSFFGNID